jgi:hypothetical protein
MHPETSLQGSLSIERMCQLGEVSRAGFYRHFQARAPIEESDSAAARRNFNFRLPTLAVPVNQEEKGLRN